MEYRKIIKKIAKENNTTPEDVEAAIQEAIDAAYTDPDPKAREMQKKIKCKGNRPTPKEFILQTAQMLQNKTHN